MRKSIREQFAEMTRLYHFTSIGSACKIIESRKLRFGKMFRMNDLIESNRIVFDRLVFDNQDDFKNNGAFAEKEMHRYQQISFSQDRKHGDEEFMGFDLHTMWGLYANRGCGACLVFDKDKLRIGDRDYAKDVEYESIIPADYGFKNKSKPGIKSEIWRRRDEIFFYKRKEWEYEQEYRVIRRAKNEMDDEYLDVSDSLSFVILCRDDSLIEGESIWSGFNYDDIKSIDKNCLYYLMNTGWMDICYGGMCLMIRFGQIIVGFGREVSPAWLRECEAFFVSHRKHRIFNLRLAVRFFFVFVGIEQ